MHLISKPYLFHKGICVGDTQSALKEVKHYFFIQIIIKGVYAPPCINWCLNLVGVPPPPIKISFLRIYTVKSHQYVIFQRIIYVSSGGRQKIQNKEIMSIVDEEDILKGGNFQWENEPIKIPKCPPSFLPYCGIIDIRYELVVSISWCKLELCLLIM